MGALEGGDGSTGTLDGVMWFSPPRTQKDQVSKPAGLGSGSVAIIHSFIFCNPIPDPPEQL